MDLKKSWYFCRIKPNSFCFIEKANGKVLPALAMKAYRGSGVIFPLILYIGAMWRQVVSFMPWLFLPPGKEPAVHGALEDGWAPQLVWTIWRRGRSLSSAKIWSPDCVAHSLVTVLTVLLQLPVGWMWLNLVVHFHSDRWRSCFLDLVIWLHWLMKF